MIPVPRPGPANEPELFARNCGEPGAAWLEAHPNVDPHQMSKLWSQFRPDLARLFSHRCGWMATWIGQEGDVDHWLPCNCLKHRNLAFEWSYYRYCAGTVNSLKQASKEVLDPCEVEEGWFEVSLPDFQLLMTDRLPATHRGRAETTLKALQLRQGHRARWTRWDWYRRYWNNGQPDLVGLRRDAPLVAAAVEKAQRDGKALPDPTTREPSHEAQRRQRRWSPRTKESKPLA